MPDETIAAADSAAHPAGRLAAPIVIRRARRADVEEITGMLARAFDDDPFMNWVIAQDARRAQRAAGFMRLALTAWTLPHGEVFVGEDCEGAALWTPPGRWRMSLWRQILVLPRIANLIGWRRFAQVSAGFELVDRRHPLVAHYYLMTLGVEPSLQGRGIGTQLIRPMLERCDLERVPAYLESSKERNVPFYERAGFRVLEEIALPKHGPHLWLMWRDPT